MQLVGGRFRKGLVKAWGGNASREKWEYRFHILETVKLLAKLHAPCVQGHHFRLTNFSLADS